MVVAVGGGGGGKLTSGVSANEFAELKMTPLIRVAARTSVAMMARSSKRVE